MTIALEAQVHAQQARTKYEESLVTLRAFISNFPVIAQRVEEHDDRLNALESRFAGLRNEIASVLAESREIPRRKSIEIAPASGPRKSIEAAPANGPVLVDQVSHSGAEATAAAAAAAAAVVDQVSHSDAEVNGGPVATAPALVDQVSRSDAEVNGGSVAAAATTGSISNATKRGSMMRAQAPREPEEFAPLSKVSFCEEQEVVRRYSLQELDATFPVHGHWLDNDVRSRRKSFEGAPDPSKQLGGREMILRPEGIEDVESLSCIVVEPMGKILSPSEFISTGIVICLTGEQHDVEVIGEWGEVLKATKWLDCGLSFALPDVSCFAEAGDLEKVVEAILKQGGFQSCLLAGKGWGGQLATEIAGRGRLSERIDGVLLVGPESPAPCECSQIEVPVMLLWASDDEVSPFQEIREWYEMLEGRRAPTFVKDLESGGHDFAELLKQGETASQVLFFTCSCLLMALLMKSLDEAGTSGVPELSDGCSRLCDELPIFLAGQIGGNAEAGVAAAISGDASQVKRTMPRLVSRLRQWIREGLQELASATE